MGDASLQPNAEFRYALRTSGRNSACRSRIPIAEIHQSHGEAGDSGFDIAASPHDLASHSIVCRSARRLLPPLVQPLLEPLNLFIREPVQIDQSGSRAVGGAEQFGEFEPDRPSVSILRVLDQKYEQECDASD